MIYRCLIALLVIAMVAGCASRRDQRNKPAAASASAEPAAAPAPAPAPARSDPLAIGGVPAMDRDRKINEQDCRTGIDLLAGNLRCR